MLIVSNVWKVWKVQTLHYGEIVKARFEVVNFEKRTIHWVSTEFQTMMYKRPNIWRRKKSNLFSKSLGGKVVKIATTTKMLGVLSQDQLGIKNRLKNWILCGKKNRNIKSIFRDKKNRFSNIFRLIFQCGQISNI